MLNLSTENKKLCFADSTPKPLSIFVYYWKEVEEDIQGGGYWQHFTTIDDTIILESAEITEGVLESNDFQLGSFVCPTIKLQWESNGFSYEDMLVVPVQKIGDEYIAYFDGYIANEEVSQDGRIVTAEIQSILTKNLDIDVLEQLQGVKEVPFGELLSDILGLTAGISLNRDLSSDFPNANTLITINNETLPQTLKASELLKMAGEFLGAHIVLKEKRIVNIEDMKTYQPLAYPIIDFITLPNIDTVEENCTYTLPYYISLYYDKIDSIKFDMINILTKTGSQLQYTYYWGSGANKYEIKNNIFFEALSTQSTDSCFEAVQNVADYLKTINFHRADLQSIYPLFIESGDCLIAKYTNNSMTSDTEVNFTDEYVAVKTITLEKSAYIHTNIIPNSNDIELSIEFSALDDTNIINSDGRFEGYNTLSIDYYNGSLNGFIGYYGGSIQVSAFEIPSLPKNQMIKFDLKCGNGTWNYSGVFKDNGTYYGGNYISTNTPLTLGGYNSNLKLSHFSYSQSGAILCDMYPCIRKSDGAIGMYDIINQEFKSVVGNASYDSGNIVIPVLSATTRGINSMRTDILCKATNISKN